MTFRHIKVKVQNMPYLQMAFKTKLTNIEKHILWIVLKYKHLGVYQTKFLFHD